MTNAQRREYDKILEDERIEERQRVDFGGKEKWLDRVKEI